MKILFIMQCANLGGMEQSTLLLMAELKQIGHEVELLSLNEMGPLGRRYKGTAFRLPPLGIAENGVGAVFFRSGTSCAPNKPMRLSWWDTT